MLKLIVQNSPNFNELTQNNFGTQVNLKNMNASGIDSSSTTECNIK